MNTLSRAILAVGLALYGVTLPGRALLLAEYEPPDISDISDRVSDISDRASESRDQLSEIQDRSSDLQDRSSDSQDRLDSIRDSSKDSQDLIDRTRDSLRDSSNIRDRIANPPRPEPFEHEPPKVYPNTRSKCQPIYPTNFLTASVEREPTYEELLELAQTVKTGSESEKIEALEELPKFKRFQMVNIARHALNDPIPEVRRTAVRVLGKIGCPRSICILQGLAKGDDTVLAAWAREALGEARKEGGGGAGNETQI